MDIDHERRCKILPKNVLYEVTNRQNFREWLIKNHVKERECWVFVKRGIPKDTANSSKSIFWYLDAIEEALCFGWIDSIVKNVPGIGLIQKMSPRGKGSKWSELNKERCRRLEKLNLMTPAGKVVLPPDMSEESFVIDPEILSFLQKDPSVWQNFQNFPALYKRVRIDFIQRVKQNKVVYENRLKNFLEKTKQNIMFGAWNDGGRLLESHSYS
ncbi:MAG: YdeI/OmpD-associated family protein [Opitutales bacterium]|nr:YdeI/OmpD-associated family protein [Opitutales bacterium]